jgi:hypothetical protein
MTDEEVNRELNKYKKMVILRQEECAQTATVLDGKVQELSAKGKGYKNALLILGVVVATKAALELAMLSFKPPPIIMNILSILFLLIGIAVSIIAQLDKNNRYEEKAGELRALSSLCISYERSFMSEYSKSIDIHNPEITFTKLIYLIDQQNDKLSFIRHRGDTLGADLTKVDVDYRIPEGD